jgi:hypothetical protein
MAQPAVVDLTRTRLPRLSWRDNSFLLPFRLRHDHRLQRHPLEGTDPLRAVTSSRRPQAAKPGALQHPEDEDAPAMAATAQSHGSVSGPATTTAMLRAPHAVLRMTV